MLSVTPTRAFFRPGEPIGLLVNSTTPLDTLVTANIYHLEDLITRCSVQMNGLQTTITGHVPLEIKRGYLAHLRVGNETISTAFDVLDDWTQAPRYGFLYDFSTDRTESDIQATFDYLLPFHVNGLQFYDWQYRHDTLLPPEDEYSDPLGRRLSLNTVRALITVAHRYGMAAMPYTAIYAASPPFAEMHLPWALYDADHQPFDFASGFLKIMNPDSGWRLHFVEECKKVLTALPFDGIHVDQYGEPQTGFDADGKTVDLPNSFAGLLSALREAIDSQKDVLFNLVHNWPVSAMANVPLNFWYSELWPPNTTLGHLWQTLRDNHRLNPRPAVLAIYIRPDWEETICAVYSVILASGGSQITHGDHSRYLSDPYFPKAGIPSPALTNRLRQLADFAVAYEEALVFAEDVTGEWLPFLQLEGMAAEPGQVIIRAAGNKLYISLLNVSGRWNAELSAPQPLNNVRLTISGHTIRHCWSASPEAPLAAPVVIDQLPAIDNWLLIGLTLEEFHI